MIHPIDYAAVRYFRMARTYAGVGLYWTGVYFVDGLLIDSGPPNLRREMARLVRELGVRACVTTHHHEDHSGNHALLTDQFGIVPLAHPLAISRLAAPAPLHLYRWLCWGSPPRSSSQPMADVVETKQFRFDVIHTPGHAEDHVVLYEPNRGWLFSGDLYLGSRLRYLRDDEDVFALMDSLKRVIALEPQVLFCHHRGRLEKPIPQLKRKLESPQETQSTVERLHAKGMSEDEIVRALPGGDLLWPTHRQHRGSQMSLASAPTRVRSSVVAASFESVSSTALGVPISLPVLQTP